MTAVDVLDESAKTARSSAPPPTEKTHYRPDIDGLRCLAVLAVIVYHAFPKLAPGGFIGVDVFFVISGFLITSLLLKAIDGDTPGAILRDFYIRRVRRIFPALILVIVATFCIGLYGLCPDALSSLGENIIGGAAFSSNIVLFRQAGYFDLDSAKKPLLHLWSLGVEEQFYIFWPLFLIGCARKTINPFLATAAVGVLSFSLNLASAYRHPDFTFYLPFTRSWELMMGAGIIVWSSRQREALPPTAQGEGLDLLPRLGRGIPYRVSALLDNFQDLRAIVGLGLIVYSIVSFNSRMSFPDWRALLPTLGAALLITANEAWLNRHILASRWMVAVGVISFPLYLWHYPLLAYLRIYEAGIPNRALEAMTVLVSFALAYLTYRIVECPIRYGAHGGLKAVCLGAVMVLVVCAGLLAVERKGFPERIPEAIRGFVPPNAGNETRAAWRQHECFLEPEEDASHFAAACAGKSGYPLALLWGDSSAAATFSGLRSVASSYGFDVAQFTASSCPPMIDTPQLNRPYCKSINDLVLHRIEELKPEIVILAAWWNYSDIPGGLARTTERLRKIGVKRIVLIGPDVQWQEPLPQVIWDYYNNVNSFETLPVRTHYRLIDRKPLDEMMRRIALDLGLWDVMCNRDGCLTRVGNKPGDASSFDVHHLSIAASAYFANAVKDEVFASDNHLSNEDKTRASRRDLNKM